MGWEVHATDDSVHAAHPVRRTALAEGIATMLSKPVLHGDNGATLKATTVLAMLYWLGVKPSYSRPRVSDDKDYVAYCTSFARLVVTTGSAPRRARLTPCARRGALASNGSNRDSFLSL